MQWWFKKNTLSGWADLIVHFISALPSFVSNSRLVFLLISYRLSKPDLFLWKHAHYAQLHCTAHSASIASIWLENGVLWVIIWKLGDRGSWFKNYLIVGPKNSTDGCTPHRFEDIIFICFCLIIHKSFYLWKVTTVESVLLSYSCTW